MKRNYNLRILKEKKSYSTQELAERMAVHVQTVRDWRKDGMKPIDEANHFPLYIGKDVKTYLRKCMEAKRMKLGPDEFYCFGCHNRATSIVTTRIIQNKKIGRNMVSVKRIGSCMKCGKKLCRIDAELSHISASDEVISRGPSASL